MRTEGEKGPPRGEAGAPHPAGRVAGAALKAKKGQGRPLPAVSGAGKGQETPGQALWAVWRTLGFSLRTRKGGTFKMAEE